MLNLHQRQQQLFLPKLVYISVTFCICLNEFVIKVCSISCRRISQINRDSQWFVHTTEGCPLNKEINPHGQYHLITTIIGSSNLQQSTDHPIPNNHQMMCYPWIEFFKLDPGLEFQGCHGLCCPWCWPWCPFESSQYTSQKMALPSQ